MEPPNEIVATSSSSDTPAPALKTPKQNYIYYTEAEDRLLLNFVAEKAQTVEKPMILGVLWTEYIDSTKSERTVKSLISRFRDNLVPKMHEFEEDYDLETRIRMVFITQYPVTEEFQKQIDPHGFLELNAERCIVTYKSHAENGLDLTLIDKYGRMRKKAGRQLLNIEGRGSHKKRKLEEEFSGDVDLFDPFFLTSGSGYIFQNYHGNSSSFLGDADPDPVEDGHQKPEDIAQGLNEIKQEYVEAEEMPTRASVPTTSATPMRYLAPRVAPQPSIRPATSTTTNKSTSLKDFLKLLKIVVVSFESPEFAGLKAKVKQAIENLGDSDENIPLDKIRLALETTLAVVSR
uniref:SPK domain-containing protein n=1 Tax=Caenorhabditis japonica TaxID=281687 RepID=A0A8R1I2D2_CAEJA